MAIVGLGQISELLLPAYCASPGREIVGLCELDPEWLARLEQEQGFCRWIRWLP